MKKIIFKSLLILLIIGSLNVAFVMAKFYSVYKYSMLVLLYEALGEDIKYVDLNQIIFDDQLYLGLLFALLLILAFFFFPKEKRYVFNKPDQIENLPSFIQYNTSKSRSPPF
jgi:glucan phosphoethanolaminetransferase (alkaline phosphatase superfamily)